MAEIKLFDIWDVSGITVKDLGLKPHINLSPIIVPTTQGKWIKKQFWKSKKSIVERLINRLFVSAHKGKKHWRTAVHHTGRKQLTYNIVKKTFQIIEQQTKKNPIQVFVTAIEVGAPKEGVATIEYGGVRYPKAMDLAPQRRVDLVLRWIVQGAFAASVAGGTKKTIADTLAKEIIDTSNNHADSNTIKKKTDLERQAEASR